MHKELVSIYAQFLELWTHQKLHDSLTCMCVSACACHDTRETGCDMCMKCQHCMSDNRIKTCSLLAVHLTAVAAWAERPLW
jgi:hypothetical protein